MDAFVVDKQFVYTYFYNKKIMGCNCKKNYNALEPYSDEYNGEENMEKQSVFYKFFVFLLGIPFGILCAALFIIVAIPLVLYVTACVIFGVQPRVKLKLPRRKKKN